MSIDGFVMNRITDKINGQCTPRQLRGIRRAIALELMGRELRLKYLTPDELKQLLAYIGDRWKEPQEARKPWYRKFFEPM